MTVQPVETSTGAKVAHVSGQILKYSGLSLLWLVQYCLYIPFVVPTVWLLKGAVKLGIVGLLLLCIPVVGWIVLALMIFSKLTNSRPRDPSKRSIWKPWGLA